LDFGPIGAVLYAAVAAFAATGLNTLAKRRDKWILFPMAIYGAVFLMIVLRGSLMIALGFAAAAYLAFVFASAVLSMKLGVRHRVARRISAHPTMVS
jgi:hypothetical protein